MTRTITSSYNWEQIYTEVQNAANIPGISNIKNTPSTLFYRDMLVNLDDVVKNIRHRETPPIMIFIYADVVRLPTDQNWLLNNVALFIVTRCIEANYETFFQLDYRNNDKNSTLSIYASEIKGPLRVKVFTSSTINKDPIIYDLSKFDCLGIQIAFQNGALIKKDLTYIGDELLTFGNELWMSLSCIFHFAIVLLESKPEIARDMLQWIKACTAPSQNTKEMYLQSCALLSQLALSSSTVNYVPYLSKTVYENVAQGFENSALQYEKQYQIFLQEKADKKQWGAAMNQMQHYFKLTSDFNQQIISQASDNLKNAQQSVNQAIHLFNRQKLTTDMAAITFQTEVSIWKEDQLLKGIFSICTALVEFVGSLALVAIGDEAAGASAGNAVVEAGKATNAAITAGGKAGKISKSMQELTNAMKELKKIGEVLGKTYTFISAVVKAAGDMKNATKFDDLTLPADNDISCQTQWDAFRIEVDNLLKEVITLGINGAIEYNVQLDKLSIYGKSVSAAQSSLIQNAQQLSSLHIQKYVSDEMQVSLDSHIKQLDKNVKPDNIIMHLLYVRGINIKQWLYIAIKNYTWAYLYWALRDSAVIPSIVKSVQELQEDLAKTKQDYLDALNTFNPPPQNFGVYDQGKLVEITDNTIITEFRNTQKAHIIIPLESTVFEGFDRIRLSTIRVWLYGVKALSPIYIVITNTGAYYDRFNGKEFRFTTTTLDRKFQYQGEPGHKKSILVDGSVADEEKYLYFQPTPFTEWQISLPNKFNSNIDVSNLTKIVLEFAGSVIGANNN